MYKRINKRIQKKQKEEDAGIDEETKEIFGLHDTDSDESDSGSSSGHGSSFDGSDEEQETENRSTRGSERPRGSSESDESERDEPEDELEDETMPVMSMADALSNPIYPTRGDIKACIVCPGKELKHAQMVSVHVTSSTHLRRVKRFATLATRVGDEEEDPGLLVAALDESVRIAPRDKNGKPASAEPHITKKDRRMAKRQRRQDRKITKDVVEARQPDPPSRSVTQTKLTRKKVESVKKHKNANPHKTRSAKKSKDS